MYTGVQMAGHSVVLFQCFLLGTYSLQDAVGRVAGPALRCWDSRKKLSLHANE